jgi:uncharacterized membrane protein
MLSAVALATCLSAGTVGGVFYAFSTFVMKALSELPAAHGLAAMQRINVVVLNPLFLGLFMGTALLAGVGTIVSLLFWSGPRSVWMLAAGTLYLVGSFIVTIAFNVPRNQRLAGVNPSAGDAAVHWATYVREWTFWNHVRTAASIASAACAGAALLS